MRDLQLQTPQSDQNSATRRMKTASDLKMNLRKTAKKSLNPVFKANSVDDLAVLESLKEFSKASDDNLFAESAEKFLASVHPADTQPSESVAVSDLTSTQSSSSVTATPYKHIVTETAYTKKPEVDSLEMAGSVEAEVVIKYLKEARIQVLKAKGVGPSKRVVEALINTIIKEIHGGVYEEDEWLENLISSKSSLVFLIFIMVFFPLLMVWFLSSSSDGSFTGPTPT